MPDNLKACKPLDVAPIWRRFVLQLDADLEHHVLHNRGKFASKLVDREPDDSAWAMYGFDRKSVCMSGLALALADEIEKEGKFGLITNFHVDNTF